MVGNPLEDLLACLPQAAALVNERGVVVWLEAGFEEKAGFALRVGESLLGELDAARSRGHVREALLRGTVFSGKVVTRALRQLRMKLQPAGEGSFWAVFESSALDEELEFAHALQEIARAVSDTNDVDAVCAAAVVAMVRCTQISRAEVYLLEPGSALRRVATSDDAAAGGKAPMALSEGSVRHSLATGQPEIGVVKTVAGGGGAIFASVPLRFQRKCLGLLVLFKEDGGSFSARDLDLWSAASAQLAVAVENARLLREAQAALQIREEFMSIASHELKTPLTPLKMCLYTMERRLAQSLPVELSSVTKAKRQVDRLSGLVNDLLDASRLELGKLAIGREPLDVCHLAAEVVREFELTFDREFSLRVPREPLWVAGDRDRLEQVLVNLLENAQKYSPGHSPIELCVEPGIGDEVRIRVTDRGIGIPGADQDQVFQRFYRARNVSDRHFGGLGLGLFISQSITQLHGGELSLSSAEGHGSTFTVHLPALGRSVAGESPRAAAELRENGA